MVTLRTARIVLAWVFVAIVIVSAFSILNATSLLNVSYDIVNRIGISSVTVSLVDPESVNPRMNVAFTVDNPTSTDLTLAYSKVIGYVFEDRNSRNQAHAWKYFENALLRRETASTHNPRIPLNGRANLTVSAEIGGISEILGFDAPQYWELVFVLQFPDVPLLGNRAILYRYVSIETSF